MSVLGFLMPLHDVECPAGHSYEVLLSSGERAALVQKHGDIRMRCPEAGCKKWACRQISLTGRMASQWKQAAQTG